MKNSDLIEEIQKIEEILIAHPELTAEFVYLNSVYGSPSTARNYDKKSYIKGFSDGQISMVKMIKNKLVEEKQ